MIVIEPPSSGSGGVDAFLALRKLELSRFLGQARRAAGVAGEVPGLRAGDARLQQLNTDFRKKRKTTDVLSFPAGEYAGKAAGDLASSVETAARQAAEHGHTLQEELRILILHGVLHLAGFDHEQDAGEMREREGELRAKLRLPLGLIERAQKSSPKRKRS